MDWIKQLSFKIKLASIFFILGKFSFLPASVAVLAGKDRLAVALIALYASLIFASVGLAMVDWLNLKKTKEVEK